MEQIISDRLCGKFPEKPIDQTLNQHFARPDSYIRTYMAGKYRFTQHSLTSFHKPETRVSELMMKDEALFNKELLQSIKDVRNRQKELRKHSIELAKKNLDPHYMINAKGLCCYGASDEMTHKMEKEI